MKRLKIALIIAAFVVIVLPLAQPLVNTNTGTDLNPVAAVGVTALKYISQGATGSPALAVESWCDKPGYCQVCFLWCLLELWWDDGGCMPGQPCQ
ncbi:MAG: hypothetical protein V1838_02910 [Patescibacteria group bacterium]